MMKTLIFLLIFLLPTLCSSMSVFRDLRKRQIMAQSFADQDSYTIAQPLQCLQQCTQQRANDNDWQTVASCIPNIQAYIRPMLQNSSLSLNAFQSILNQPPIEECARECDGNRDNIVGDLIQGLKYFTNFACEGDLNDADNDCFNSLTQVFPNLRQEDVANAPGGTIACKLAGITKQICRNSKKPANAMAAFVNILTTFESNLPYTPINKC